MVKYPDEFIQEVLWRITPAMCLLVSGLKDPRAIDMSGGVSSNIFGPVRVVCGISAHLVVLEIGKKKKGKEKRSRLPVFFFRWTRTIPRGSCFVLQDEHDNYWLVGSFVRASLFAGR